MRSGSWKIQYIYAVNCVIGADKFLQIPASMVVQQGIGAQGQNRLDERCMDRSPPTHISGACWCYSPPPAGGLGADRRWIFYPFV